MSLAAYQKTVQVKSTGSTAYGVVPANAASLNLPAELLDDTDFTSTGFRSRIIGLRDWNVSLTVLHDAGSTVIDEVRSAWISATKLDVQYLPNGTNGFSGSAYVETFSMSGDVGGLETIEVTLQPDSALSTV